VNSPLMLRANRACVSAPGAKVDAGFAPMGALE
jgi:hypothetical protein